MRPFVLALAVSLACSACANELDPTANEDLSSAVEAVTAAQGICIGAVTLGASLGCVTATAACTGTTYLTVGGTAYPCSLVLAAACAGVPASAAVYIAQFCTR